MGTSGPDSSQWAGLFKEHYVCQQNLHWPLQLWALRGKWWFGSNAVNVFIVFSTVSNVLVNNQITASLEGGGEEEKNDFVWRFFVVSVFTCSLLFGVKNELAKAYITKYYLDYYRSSLYYFIGSAELHTELYRIRWNCSNLFLSWFYSSQLVKEKTTTLNPIICNI